jgi:hypothetical protein
MEKMPIPAGLFFQNGLAMRSFTLPTVLIYCAKVQFIMVISAGRKKLFTLIVG